MIANYHCHTPRCGHALGSEREYIACALERGLQILGFSDHTPYDFLEYGTGKRGIRMQPEELPGYTETLRSLAEEYRGRIRVLTGVEAEYYPRYFPRLLEMLRANGVEYMILGQHFPGNEIDESYCGWPSDGAALDRYVSQCVEALQTGLFSCFAHPDLIRFVGEDREYERQMRRLCRAARETKTPLEINLLGIREGRHYPDERFWRIAGEEGNAVILGCDAHRPEDLLDLAAEEKGLALVSRFGLDLSPTLDLRPL